MSNLIIVFFLAVLAVLSVYGAFLGAERAQVFFNAAPMTVFWCLFLLFLSAGFVIYPSLMKRYPLIMIHLGCILVLAGGLYGSYQGHVLSEKARALSRRIISRLNLSKEDDKESNATTEYTLFQKGLMQLHRGQSSDLVATLPAGDIIKLPFSIVLKDAFIDYYGNPTIRLYGEGGALIDIPAEVGESIQLPEGRGTIQVVKAYRNLKLRPEEGQMVPYDDEGAGSNPAWELIVTAVNGETKTLFVFELFPMHTMQSLGYTAEYVAPQMVKDYKSVLQVVDRGEHVKESMIEVNKPLYYRGYHFYQNTFGFDQSGPVSGLLVTSVRGVGAVFFGYGLIFTGLIIQCVGKLRKRTKSITEHKRAAIQTEG